MKHLSEAEKANGVIACSAGNHAQGFFPLSLSFPLSFLSTPFPSLCVLFLSFQVAFWLLHSFPKFLFLLSLFHFNDKFSRGGTGSPKNGPKSQNSHASFHTFHKSK